MVIGETPGKCPELVKEWHPNKNGEKLPSMYPPGSHESIWWRCLKCKHEGPAEFRVRVNDRGCPKCGKKKKLGNSKKERRFWRKIHSRKL